MHRNMSFSSHQMKSNQGPSLIVRLRGGLGNQLFQYAAARSLALRNDVPLLLDTRSGFTKDPYGRRYELHVFRIVSALGNPKDVSIGFVSSLLNSVFRFREYFRGRVMGRQFDPRLFRSRIRRKPQILDCYCQSFRYFEGIEDILRRELAFDAPPDGIDEGVVQEIQTSNSVCLHVRRLHGQTADGLSVSSVAHYYGACGVRYYRQALRTIASKRSPLRVFVFSDDIQWAQHNLKSLAVEGCTLTVIEDADPLRNFYLMKACKHFVIANSTFSWWAAWLGAFPEKTVCVPPVWNQGERIFPRDMFPENWMIIHEEAGILAPEEHGRRDTTSQIEGDSACAQRR